MRCIRYVSDDSKYHSHWNGNESKLRGPQHFSSAYQFPLNNSSHLYALLHVTSVGNLGVMDLRLIRTLTLGRRFPGL
jgi:hypothetical protein